MGLRFKNAVSAHSIDDVRKVVNNIQSGFQLKADGNFWRPAGDETIKEWVFSVPDDLDIKNIEELAGDVLTSINEKISKIKLSIINNDNFSKALKRKETIEVELDLRN